MSLLVTRLVWSHLALQLRDAFSKLSFRGFRQLRVETLGQTLHPVLLVFVLQPKTENVLAWKHTVRCRQTRSYLTLHFRELSGELRLQRLRQLVVKWTQQLLLRRVFIQDLEGTEVFEEDDGSTQ